MAEINAIKYFKAVNATLFTSGLLCNFRCISGTDSARNMLAAARLLPIQHRRRRTRTVCSPVCARTCLCVSVCAHVSVCACVRTMELRRARYREQRRNPNAHHVETEMTCRHVNKVNNIRPFSLFNKRAAIDLFYRKGNLKGLMLRYWASLKTQLCV